mgnify:CR=1 FL=1
MVTKGKASAVAIRKLPFLQRGSNGWNTMLIGIIVAEFVIFGIANPKFLRPQLFFTSLQDSMPIFIIATFATFVMMTGGIDIQAPAIVGLTSITIGVAWQDFGFSVWGAMGIAFILAVACGALSGFFVAYCGVQAMVVTLGGRFLYAGLALLISTLSSTASYQGISGFPNEFKMLASIKIGAVPIDMIFYILLLIIAYLLLDKSKYGRKVTLIGVNPQAAEYSGINTRWIIMSTYMLSAASAAVAGILITSYLGTAKSDLGSDLTMDIVTAIVLGGTLSTGGKGSVIGTALSSLVIAVVRFGLPLCFSIGTQYLDIPVGILLIVIIVGRSAFGGSRLITRLLSRFEKSGKKVPEI